MAGLYHGQSLRKSYIQEKANTNNHMISFITIYLAFGLLFGILIEEAYRKRDNQHPDFSHLEGEWTWLGRIMTIMLWPVICIIAIRISRKSRNGE